MTEFQIPPRMWPGIERYVQRGVRPGTFLQAVIRNDLRTAVMCADTECARNLPAFVDYFFEQAPAECSGSKGAMDAWIEMGGREGINARYECEVVA